VNPDNSSRDLPEFLESLGRVFKGYTQKYYYWELVIIARKSMLAVISIVFVVDSQSQIMLGLLVLFFSAICHARCMPFIHPHMNTLEFLSIFVSATTFFASIFTLEDGASESLVHSLSVFVFVANFIFFIFAFFGCISLERENNTELLSTSAECLGTTDEKNEEALSLVAPFEPYLVITQSAFTAKVPNQLSFSKGDVIEVVQDCLTDQWSSGILKKSTSHPITSQIGQFLPKLAYRPVISIDAYAAVSKNQLSFAKGDLIQVVNTLNERQHYGILRSSSTFPVTGKVGFYPSKLVRGLEIADLKSDFFRKRKSAKMPQSNDKRNESDAIELATIQEDPAKKI